MQTVLKMGPENMSVFLAPRLGFPMPQTHKNETRSTNCVCLGHSFAATKISAARSVSGLIIIASSSSPFSLTLLLMQNGIRRHGAGVVPRVLPYTVIFREM